MHVPLIGHAKVIYDAFPDPKRYISTFVCISHVQVHAYTYARTQCTRASCGETPGGSHCTWARSHNLDRDYFYHSHYGPPRPFVTYACSVLRVVTTAFMRREKRRSARDGARARMRALRSTGTNNKRPRLLSRISRSLVRRFRYLRLPVSLANAAVDSDLARAVNKRRTPVTLARLSPSSGSRLALHRARFLLRESYPPTSNSTLDRI